MAASEFHKLKTISSERKQSLASLKQEKEDLLHEVEHLKGRLSDGEKELDSRIQQAVEASRLQSAAELAQLTSELNEARMQLELVSASSSHEATLAQGQVREVQLKLEAALSDLATLREAREADRCHLEDAKEQRDALKEAVQDIKVSATRWGRRM